jgi:hypothetical protein
MTNQVTVAKVNNVSIIVIENGEKRVAVKPICEALGIAFEPQFTKLKNDPILKSTVTLSVMVGADKKERQMQTIPLKYVFGWLFRIDSRNVKEESRDAVLKYQMECYDALYNHFTSYADFVEKKQKAVDAQFEIYDQAKQSYSQANKVMKEAEKELKKMRQLTFENYDAEQRQLKIFSEEEQEG